jgi:hypothetical protein
MNSEEIYDTWREHRNRIEVGQGFSDKLMRRLHRYEQERRRWPLNVQQLVDLVSARPLAKVVLLGAGAVMGLIRIACILNGLFGHYVYCG